MSVSVNGFVSDTRSGSSEVAGFDRFCGFILAFEGWVIRFVLGG